MKTEIFCFDDENELQQDINDFLKHLSEKGYPIIDIKFSTCTYPWGDTDHYETSFSAIVLYKEEF